MLSHSSYGRRPSMAAKGGTRQYVFAEFVIFTRHLKIRWLKHYHTLKLVFNIIDIDKCKVHAHGSTRR